MKTLYNFKKFIDELNRDNSRKYKTAVLEAHKDDEDIKYYLDFIFNPFIITGISNKKLNRKVETDYSTELLTIIDILNYAKTHNTGSDKDLSIIFSNRDTLFESFNLNVFLEEDVNEQQFGDIIASLYDLFDKVLVKNLQIGIDAKTINKVIPNLIPTFNVQLAEKYFDKPDFVEGKEFALTTKIDGGRIIAIKKNGDVKFYTRSGQLYEGLVDLEEEMKLYMPDNLVLDGEITLLNDYEVLYDLKYNEPCIGRKLTSKEQYKETMKITRRDGEKHGVKMLVFDVLTADAFEKQICYSSYKERRQFLTSIFPTRIWTTVDDAFVEYIHSHTFKFFDLLPILYQGTDTSEIDKWLNYNIEQGEEGVMINICDAPYEFKRTNNLLKVKQMKTMDLQVIDMEEGTNSNKGVLGALLVRYKDGNVVKVGSGYSKELRSEIWNNKEKWIGAIIEVQYFEETENDNGGKSLRFPVFKDIRTDKDVADY